MTQKIDLAALEVVAEGGDFFKMRDALRATIRRIKELEILLETPEEVALRLTKPQRKQLRQASRNMRPSGSFWNNPVMNALLSTDHYPQLQEGADIVEWCDWEHSVRMSVPRLTELGCKVLAIIDDPNGPSQARFQ